MAQYDQSVPGADQDPSTMTKAKYLEKCLVHRIRDTGWPAGGVLPTVRSLALELGAAPVTILKAIEGLHRRGLISKQPGGRRWLTRAGLEAHERLGKRTDAVVPRPQAIAMLLRKEILSGSHAPDQPLPSQNELAGRHGCSVRTARAAYGLLEQWGLVEYHGKRYLLSKASGGARSRTRFFLVGHPSILTAYHGHAFSLILSIERAVHALDGGELRFYLTENPSTQSAPDDSEVGAFLYLAQRDMEQWMKFLAARRRVTAVVMDYTELTFTRNLTTRKRMIQLLPDNQRAGREIGLHLRARGHSHVALFAPWDLFEGWSILRKTGLGEVYPEHALYCQPVGKRGGRMPPEIERASRSFVGEISKIWDYHPKQMDAVKGDLFDHARQSTMGRSLEPLFAQALRECPSTAWIGINDEVAVAACAWLRRRRDRKARAIEVVGFDNSPLSHALGFTSYDFDFPRMGRLAVQSVVRPSPGLSAGGGSRVVRMPGHVIPRRLAENR